MRLLTLDDAESVYLHFSDDEVTHYLDIESCTCPEKAKEIIEFHLKDSGCRWGIFEKGTGMLIGTCGYHCWSQDSSNSEAEIGYDLGRAYWGQGLMREVLETVIPFGFTEMKLRKILASVAPRNERSIRLLCRLGFESEAALRDGLRWLHRTSPT